ncbi:MAG: hypothetical protein WBM70_04705 [Sulfurovum sp.]|uniref:hypothetical protein n=1 Tax=Sulfurovum sp. TaxID=1969726 RepID=UPI003C7146E0
MTFDEIRFALEVNGVEKEDSEMLLAYCRKSGKNYEKLDEMLIDMGYVKVFTDEFFGWDNPEEEDFDDEYFSIEKNQHKHVWEE